MVTKGAPEAVLRRCRDVPPQARAALDAEFAAGNRVVAVATRAAAHEYGHRARGRARICISAGFLVFLDPPKRDAAESLRRLASLGIAVKVVTGDNPAVALKVCHDLGLADGAALSGTRHRRARTTRS